MGHGTVGSWRGRLARYEVRPMLNARATMRDQHKWHSLAAWGTCGILSMWRCMKSVCGNKGGTCGADWAHCHTSFSDIS